MPVSVNHLPIPQSDKILIIINYTTRDHELNVEMTVSQSAGLVIMAKTCLYMSITVKYLLIFIIRLPLLIVLIFWSFHTV